METASIEYDANGNITHLAGMELVFDVENRLVELRHEIGVEQYAYDAGNRRIWKKQPDGVEEFYLYGEDSRLMAVYQLTEADKGAPEFELVDYSVYFAKKLIRSRDRAVVLNRQHSVETEVGREINRKTRYLSFGEEESATEENRVKFGTYRRDATSGLDYAEQRYYSSEFGRFITPDPYVQSIQLDEPETWNRYAYCGNDPINRIDPHGTYYCKAIMSSTVNRYCNNYSCPNNAYAEYYAGGSMPGSGCPYWEWRKSLGGAPPNGWTYQDALAVMNQLNVRSEAMKKAIWTLITGPIAIGFFIANPSQGLVGLITWAIDFLQTLGYSL